MQGKFLMTSWGKNSLILILLWGFIQSQESNQIYGFITDQSSGEALIGANVYLAETDRGTATNHDGYFVLSAIPRGDYSVIVSYLGYSTLTKRISLKGGDDFEFSAALIVTPIEMSNIEVTGEEVDRRVNIQISRNTLNMRQLKYVPQLGNDMPWVVTQYERQHIEAVPQEAPAMVIKRKKLSILSTAAGSSTSGICPAM